MPSLQLPLVFWCLQPWLGWQESRVHALLSSQLMVVNTHPVAGLQESAVQRLLSLQVIGVPWQTPATQVSVLVQTLPSLQAPVTFV